MKKKALSVLAALAACVALPSMALAINAPAADGFAYDIYQVAVEQILKGPIGFVAGTAAIVLGAVSAIRSQIMMAIPAILGGAFLLKADSVVTSLGALIGF